jgi:uncharacterized damage-inducible protein DinB
LIKSKEMKLFYTLLVSLSFFAANAQNTFADSLKYQMVQEWERAKSYTQEYLNAMPADKYDFRPTDSVRSFAQQMLHLAGANALMASVAMGVPNPFPTQNFEKSPSLQNKDSVVYYVNTSYDVMIAAIKNMDVSKLNEEVTRNLPGGKRVTTRFGWLLKAFEHQTHHRGQCTVYFRLLGLRPPAEKLF